MSNNWVTANHAYLAGEIEGLAARMRGDDAAAVSEQLVTGLDARAPALVEVAEIFELTRFEIDVLVMAAGCVLDATFARSCGAPASFGLAVEKLPDAHWSAFSPDGPLRRWHLVEPVGAGPMTGRVLEVDERVLNYLLGVDHDDPALAALVHVPTVDLRLVPTHRRLAERVAEAWKRTTDAGLPAVTQLCGADSKTLVEIAVTACSLSGLEARVAAAHGLPRGADELVAFARRWEREASLLGAALVLDCAGLLETDRETGAVIDRLLGEVGGLVVLVSRDRRPAPVRRLFHTIDVERPTESEQCDVWVDRLGDAGPSLGPQIDALAAQFDLAVSDIEAACRDAQLAPPPVADALWDACRSQARSGMAALARRIEGTASWDDLVVTDLARDALESVVRQVRHRARVYREWGFGARGSRGRGISALFAGPSGTGKTMAAEVLANELRLDLYAIDLSAMVSKYIGETEKNLRQVFDAAESSGAILLFDEADALFGRRSEVKDSHDRYANIEVSYLLHRIENYRGIAILTSNIKSALDVAFLRRISVIAEFPFPDESMRTLMWQRAFPNETPTKDLDPKLLAQLHVSGGSIRNIALAAAFLAAEADEPVTFDLVRRAAMLDYAKSDRHVTPAELRGWP